MVETSLPKGVRILRERIYIRFIDPQTGKRKERALDYAPTPANITLAGNIRAHIIELHKDDLFNEAEFFGDNKSEEESTAKVSPKLFSSYAQRWLDLPTHDWSSNTRKKYKDILQNHWMPHLHDRVALHIDYDTLLDSLTLSGVGQKSASYYNDCLTVIRGVFNLVHAHPDQSPTRRLTNKKRIKDEPDPFTIDEANEIIALAYKKHGVRAGAWFELGFYSGMRAPGEMLGLKWTDFDLRSNTVKVQRLRLTNGKIQEHTKTRVNRLHNLNSRSRHAIDQLKPLTFLNNDFLFYHDDGKIVKTGKIFRNDFKRILKKLGIRERRMYDMRHTFATFGLMNGVNPAYLANQLGHSIEEFFKTYSKWINSVMDDLQIRLIEEAILKSGGKSGEITPFLELQKTQATDFKRKELERETRLELATPTLARLCSTTELFPHT